VRVTTGGHRCGSTGRRGVRGRGKAHGGYVRPRGRTEMAGHREALHVAGEVAGVLQLQLAHAPVMEAAKLLAIPREWLRGTSA
jgi:hypothetical protein